MNTVLFIVLKVILALYLTEAIIIMWRIIKATTIECWKIIKTRYNEDILPSANGNFKLAFILTSVILSVMLIPAMVMIIGKSTWMGLKWPVTFIKAIREEN